MPRTRRPVLGLTDLVLCEVGTGMGLSCVRTVCVGPENANTRIGNPQHDSTQYRGNGRILQARWGVNCPRTLHICPVHRVWDMVLSYFTSSHPLQL
ncbi:hypothetical protein FIBSPDRAFT_850771, partial [Athelia psychrophila]